MPEINVEHDPTDPEAEAATQRVFALLTGPGRAGYGEFFKLELDHVLTELIQPLNSGEPDALRQFVTKVAYTVHAFSRVASLAVARSAVKEGREYDEMLQAIREADEQFRRDAREGGQAAGE